MHVVVDESALDLDVRLEALRSPVRRVRRRRVMRVAGLDRVVAVEALVDPAVGRAVRVELPVAQRKAVVRGAREERGDAVHVVVVTAYAVARDVGRKSLSVEITEVG